MPICWPGITGLGRCPLGPYWTGCPGGGSITGAPTAGGWPIICWPGYIPGCIPPWMGCPVAELGPAWPVIGPCPCCAASPLFTLVISWILDLRLSLLIEFNLMKYFWAWLATCVGVLEITKFRDILRQSPFPNLANPNKKSLQKHFNHVSFSQFYPFTTPSLRMQYNPNENNKRSNQAVKLCLSFTKMRFNVNPSEM
jgi:hypothetical protein